MTVVSCLSLCASKGFEYAGLEYRQECYCGDKPPPYERLREEQCDAPCAGGTGGSGEAKCGGALSLSVYRQSPLPPPSSLSSPADLSRPLVCLVMMLKNEAHTIAHTLRSIRDAVDCWVVLDTGSDDGAPALIQTWFDSNPSALLGKPVPGKMFFEPFVDYGATRCGEKKTMGRSIARSRGGSESLRNDELPSCARPFLPHRHLTLTFTLPLCASAAATALARMLRASCRRPPGTACSSWARRRSTRFSL